MVQALHLLKIFSCFAIKQEVLFIPVQLCDI